MSVDDPLSLDVPAPDHVIDVLRRAAIAYRQSAAELPAVHGNPRAGRIWKRIANRLDGAADGITKIIETHGIG